MSLGQAKWFSHQMHVYEDFSLLGYIRNTVYRVKDKSRFGETYRSASSPLGVCFLLGLLLKPEDEKYVIFRNIG
jgi:hypothetical protein